MCNYVTQKHKTFFASDEPNNRSKTVQNHATLGFRSSHGNRTTWERGLVFRAALPAQERKISDELRSIVSTCCMRHVLKLCFTTIRSAVPTMIQNHSIYKIRHTFFDDNVLDLSGADHVSVLGWTESGSENQQWSLTHEESNLYGIRSVISGKYAAVSGKPRNGAPIEVTDTLFLWEVGQENDPHGGEVYTLDLGGPQEDVEVWVEGEDRHQCWRLELQKSFDSDS
ncbi:hypothetical protein D9756_001222 [Leucocoprinus leucothites]|uniref:Ricin B lectin domain-containing protein n=1 Tax=Leucocoprinus leucothites TaxID=201217 RepID=A0A8H5G3T0_9AGAR|nr:hypothetical protein D9756_001222 [Leucoagaricus leucothites]